MGNADVVSAAFGLLLGLAAQHSSLAATVEVAHSGPFVALDKAHEVAAAESQRARESDGEAARTFAPGTGDAAANAGDVAAPQASSGDAAGAPPAAAARAAAEGVVTGPAPIGPADNAPGSPDAAVKYDASRHRDPFRPPNLTAAVSEKAGPRTPLEGYEIGQLKLVGIIQDGDKPRAMVEDSAGLGYIVTLGTPIGSSGGIVRSIEQRKMRVEETTTNFYGEKQAKQVVLELPQEDRSP